MLDVHPAHHAANTWRDFFTHIATITVGLLIAVALEQTVEAIHHHHQREYLEQELHTEAERNLGLIRGEMLYVSQYLTYLDQCLLVLENAPVNGGLVTVTLPSKNVTVPEDGMLISPSQATWTVARADGTVALLASEAAKIYTRVDLDVDFERAAETSSNEKLATLASTLARDHVSSATLLPSRISLSQRDELIFVHTEARQSAADLQFRLAILRGALQAVLDNVHSLEEMYPYQGRAVKAASATP